LKEFSIGIAPYIICKKTKKIKILMIQSSKKSEYGFIKGKKDNDETDKETAIRETEEEVYFEINDKNYLEKSFFQKNKKKDIKIYLININNINNLKKRLKKNKIKIKNREVYQCKLLNLNKKQKIMKNQEKIWSSIIIEMNNNIKSYEVLF